MRSETEKARLGPWPTSRFCRSTSRNFVGQDELLPKSVAGGLGPPNGNPFSTASQAKAPIATNTPTAGAWTRESMLTQVNIALPSISGLQPIDAEIVKASGFLLSLYCVYSCHHFYIEAYQATASIINVFPRSTSFWLLGTEAETGTDPGQCIVSICPPRPSLRAYQEHFLH
jgi:hypothetical protein